MSVQVKLGVLVALFALAFVFQGVGVAAEGAATEELTTIQGVVSVEKVDGAITAKSPVSITVKATVEGKETTTVYNVEPEGRGRALVERNGKTVIAKGVVSTKETEKGKELWIKVSSFEDVKEVK